MMHHRRGKCHNFLPFIVHLVELRGLLIHGLLQPSLRIPADLATLSKGSSARISPPAQT
jgi:hypothetical protein